MFISSRVTRTGAACASVEVTQFAIRSAISATGRYYLNPLVDKLKQELLKRWLPLHQNLPERLFHYTDAPGLQGIICTTQLWATHAGYLNDPQELQYASGLASEIIGNQIHGAQSEAVRSLLRILSEGNYSALNDFVEVYVACFCDNGDLPTQWRTYGGGGRGYTIGIKPESLCEYTKGGSQDKNFTLRKVFYDTDRQTELIQDAIDLGCKVVMEIEQRYGSSTAQEDMPHVVNHVRSYISECICCFKRPHFKLENEWRAI